MRYRVLWIDDDYKTQDDFIGDAEQDEIDIYPFESHEEGIQELESNPNYHAVILDAKVKNKKSDTVTGLDGLRASRDHLLKFNESGYLPFFIFTGQPDYAEEEWFRQSFGEYFLKGRDNEELFAAIKDAVSNKVDYIVEKEYREVFEACTEDYFGFSSKKILMNALKIVEGHDSVENTDEFLNSLRKVYEKIFAAFHRSGFIPDDIFKQPGWINNSRKFLAGQYYGYELKEEIFSPMISFVSKNVLYITQDGSHNEGTLRLEAVAHIHQLKTDFLYKSMVLQTLDVICWAKKFLEEHPNKEENRAFWKKNEDKEIVHGEWIKGKISEIQNSGWGTFSSSEGLPDIGIPPSMIRENSLLENMLVKIKTRPGKHPTQPFVDQIEKDFNLK